MTTSCVLIIARLCVVACSTIVNASVMLPAAVL